MRLIDADALQAIYHHECCGECDMCDHKRDRKIDEYRYEIRCALIDDAPAVDAEPVRHAAWMYEISFEDESKRDDFDVTCTGCGALFGAESRDDAEILIMGRWDYCPFCGAKMDGGADGE